MLWSEMEEMTGADVKEYRIRELQEKIKRLEKKLADATHRGGGFVSTSHPSPPPRGAAGDVTIHVDVGADPPTEAAIAHVMAEHARRAMRS